jgi:hypothetical protein
MFGRMMIDERAIGDSAFRSRLDERGRRLYAAAEVRAIGYGGLAAVARAAGESESSGAGYRRPAPLRLNLSTEPNPGFRETQQRTAGAGARGHRRSP